MAGFEPDSIPAGLYTYGGDGRSLVKLVKSGRGSGMDRRFLIIALVSLAGHIAGLIAIGKHEPEPVSVTIIEEVPERFAKLIIEKPIQEKKETVKKGMQAQEQTPFPEKSSSVSKRESADPVQKEKVQRSVNARVARVEEKIRTVGVLGMLTGVGTTASGPSVVDVLGSLKDKKERRIDLEDELDKITGLQKADKIDVLNKKLIRSKELSVSLKENIDDLLANAGRNESGDLVKRGSFIIQKPESIEGAASLNAKRDDASINTVVSSHKTSIRMSYEKHLKRDPSLAGKITVRFTISLSGSVTLVMIVENTTGNIEFEEEIKRKIRMWKFEPVSEGDVTVTYPFVFSSAG